MKKLLCAMMCLGLLMGCSNEPATDKGKDKDTNQQTQKEEKTDLEKVSEVLTLSVEKTESQSNVVKAKDKDGNQFMMYMDFQGNDKTLATTLNIKENEVAFSTKSEANVYLINLNYVMFTNSDQTADDMKATMETYLKDKGLTLDQVKNALTEEYNKK